MVNVFKPISTTASSPVVASTRAIVVENIGIYQYLYNSDGYTYSYTYTLPAGKKARLVALRIFKVTATATGSPGTRIVDVYADGVLVWTKNFARGTAYVDVLNENIPFECSVDMFQQLKIGFRLGTADYNDLLEFLAVITRSDIS